MQLKINRDTSVAAFFNLNGPAYWGYLGIICGMFYLRDVAQISIPLFLFLAVFAAGYLVLDYDHSLALTAMLPVLNMGVQTNLIVIMALVAYFYKYGSHFRLNIVHALVALLMFLELLHVGIQPFSFPQYIRYVVQYVYLAVILGESRIKYLLKDPVIVLRTFVFMAFYFMLDVLLVTARYVDMSEIVGGSFRFGVLDEFLSGVICLYDNENMVGMFAVAAINFLMICMIKTKKRIIWDSLLIAYFVYFGFLTKSRTFLILLVVSAALYGLYFLYLFRKSLGKSLLIILVAVLLVYLAVNVFFPDVMEGVIERFEEKDLDNGRGELFDAYNEYMFEHAGYMLMGIGLQSLKEKTGVWNTPHNGLHEAFICWGIVGLILVLCLLYLWLRLPRKYSGRKVPWCYYIPCIIFFINIQTMQFVRLWSIFNMMIPLFIAAYAGGLSDEPEKISDHG